MIENGAEGGFEPSEDAEGFSGGSGMPALDNVENGQSAVTPTVSYPRSLSRAAATELSTPPLMPINTRSKLSPPFDSLLIIPYPARLCKAT